MHLESFCDPGEAASSKCVKMNVLLLKEIVIKLDNSTEIRTWDENKHITES